MSAMFFYYVLIGAAAMGMGVATAAMCFGVYLFLWWGFSRVPERPPRYVRIPGSTGHHVLALLALVIMCAFLGCTVETLLQLRP